VSEARSEPRRYERAGAFTLFAVAVSTTQEGAFTLFEVVVTSSLNTTLRSTPPVKPVES